MTYSAPKQQLFAFFLLVSFCLHTFLLVFSTIKQTNQNRAYKGEHMVAQIINESRLALANEDRVSLSVIANRYANEYDVNRILIRNLNNEVLVKVGNAPMQEGENINKMATDNEVIIGRIELTMKSADSSEIVKALWLFILGSLIIHSLLWLLYRHFARPNKLQIQTLSEEIHGYYQQQLAVQQQQGLQQKQASYQQNQTQSVLATDTFSNTDVNNNININEHANINDDTNQPQISKINHKNDHKLTQKKVFADLASYIQAQQTSIKSGKANSKQTVITQSEITQTANKTETVTLKSSVQQSSSKQQVKGTEQADKTSVISTNSPTNRSMLNSTQQALNNELPNASISKEDKAQTTVSTSTLSASMADQSLKKDITSLTTKALPKTKTQLSTSVETRPSMTMGKLRLQLRYVDNHRLLDKLSPVVAEPYFQLCSQLLKQAIKELLKDDSFQDIKLSNTPEFSRQGAIVEFSADKDDQQSQQKLLLASVMLAILYKMLNQIVYDKHRELGRFAFAVAIGISHIEQQDAVKQLIKHHSKGNDIALLLTKSALQFLQTYISLRRINYPTNVAERECVYVDKVDEKLLQALGNVRNSVLKVDESEQVDKINVDEAGKNCI